MARSPSQHPTELELEILKVLWRIGPATVRTVREELAAVRELAYTSVMTMMTIMTKKGYLSRRKKGPGYLYRATISEETTKHAMLFDLVDRAFEGSAAALMVNLLEKEKVKPGELDELRRLIDEKAKEGSK
jgi:BlaI family transcriptional regulator, penicillinase repressor